MIICYLIGRAKRPDIVLSPYPKQDPATLWEEEEQVCLKSSGTLTKQQKDEATYALYASVDFAVDRWIQDKQYVPRLLVSALVFLAIYFFLSLVIRDPIPMVDELVASSLATVATWIYLSRRDTRSSLAAKRRYELKAKAGSPVYETEEGLLALEMFLDEVAQMDSLDLCEALCGQGTEKLPVLTMEDRPAWAREVLSLLLLDAGTFRKSLLGEFAKVKAARNGNGRHSSLPAHLFHLSTQGKLDAGLLALLVALDETVG
jgi:hypothetical protein